MAKKKKLGKDFEEAVHRFVSALDPNAKVTFDAKIRDRDAGTWRQADVWIEGTFGGHIPFTALVSCKDKGRKIDVQQMGAFCDEVRSTGASYGVMYSRTGFTEGAFAKAKARGIACCRLYRNQPSDLPALTIGWYICLPKARLSVIDVQGCLPFKTWADLLNEVVHEVGGDITLHAKAQELIARAQEHGAELGAANILPVDSIAAYPFKGDSEEYRCKLVATVYWNKYRAQDGTTIVNGSYCLSNSDFRGTRSGPVIDLQSDPPGPAWMPFSQDVPTESIRLILVPQIRPNIDLKGSRLWNEQIPLTRLDEERSTGCENGDAAS